MSQPKILDVLMSDTTDTKAKCCDFRGRHELAWNKIEDAISAIAWRVQAVEMIGRGAQDDVHGESLTNVFVLLTDDISCDIEQLKDLLGLAKEVRP